MVKEAALSWIDENEKEIIKISDKAWEYAEVGLRETKTSKLFADWIEKQGFKLERGVAEMPTAFVATWSNGEGPTIGLMGELDALAGLSQKAVPHKEPIKEGEPGQVVVSTEKRGRTTVKATAKVPIDSNTSVKVIGISGDVVMVEKKEG